MSEAFRIGGANTSVSLACSNVAAEIELPTLPNGNFPPSYLVQQEGGLGLNRITFIFGRSIADSPVAIASGAGVTTRVDGEPLPPIEHTVGASRENRYVRAIMATNTATLLITPLEGSS